MARGPKYKVPRRRRREGKTNYYKRYKMILSGKPRFVVRKTLNYIWAQVVIAKPQGDIVVAAAHSNELVKKYGWKGGTANTPAAYLTGLLAGLRALQKGVREAILDIGLHRPTRGGIVFAVAKGGIDAGLKIPVGEEMFPSEDRIRGVHIAIWSKMLREKGLVERYFSRYLSRGLNPEELPAHFDEVKKKILLDYGGG
ncbi:50S ribosomal protein L18 [Thermogladius sp. 4427co]|uniref:50S ribosomal protein L18 n=1 Tax=Thermogladius sp. 4427co TaxID=3450718 RepID=UPI003F795526